MRPLATVTRCSTTAEPNISMKKYSSGLPACQSSRAFSSHSLPALTATSTAPWACGGLELVVEMFRGKFRAGDDEPIADKFHGIRLPRVNPRPAVFREPLPRRVGEFASAAIQLMPARIAEQPFEFGFLHADVRFVFHQFHRFENLCAGRDRQLR